MGIKAVFYKTGYRYGYYWKRQLRVEVDNETLGTIGRETYLAQVIEKYIIRDNFFSSNKTVYQKNLTFKQYNLLKGLMEADSKYWQIYEKALRKRWTMKELEAQLFWRIV